LSSHGLGSTPSGSGRGALTGKAIAAAKAGDPEGVHYLYVRFGEEVEARAMAFVRERGEATEIVTWIFAGLHETIVGYDGRRPFGDWLGRLAHDAALDHLRRGRPLRAEEVVLPEGRREVLFFED
jgi:DNA-directed RNA polymerase specialized sigma24 family protein